MSECETDIFQVSDCVFVCVCPVFAPSPPSSLPSPQFMFQGKAGQPGLEGELGTTSKKMGTGPERWAMRGRGGWEGAWGMSVVLGWSQREGTLRTWPHFLGPPTLSLLIFASFLFRVPVEREGNQVPQGSRALRYGEDGWPGTPCKPLVQAHQVPPNTSLLSLFCSLSLIHSHL